VADYSEFPTTPTAWQDQQWQMVAPLDVEDQPRPQPRRRTDLVSLIAGLLFIAFALFVMVDVDLPVWMVEDGGVLWVFLIGAGAALLVRELRRARNRS
jgi:hypothetical protein